jgi:glycosyltransferase involved in cell wall biosynthesis
MNTPRISVIIPAYNAAPYLAEAVDSVLAQTLQPSEILIVNDGSTDATAEVLARYNGNPLIRILHLEHQGVSAARNQAIRASTGSHIAFLDADDRWHPEKLATQLPLFAADSSILLVYSEMQLFGEGQGRYSAFAGCTFRQGEVLRALIRENFVPTSSVVIRREALFHTGLFPADPRITIGEDYHLWLRIAAHGTFAFSSQPLVDYRIHRGQTSRNRAQNYASLLRMFAALLADPTFTVPFPVRLAACCRLLATGIKYLLYRFIGN